jgi:hypothetical protein
MTKKSVLIVSVSVLLVVVIGLIFFHGGSDSVIVGRALNVIDSLQADKYQEAERDFHSIIKAKLSPEALGQSWSKTIAKYGPLKKRVVIRVDNRFMENRCVEINCMFEKATLYGYIRFNTNDEVTGVSIRTEPDPLQK